MLPASAKLISSSAARTDRARPCLGYRQQNRTVNEYADVPRNSFQHSEQLDSICSALNERKFLKGDLALFALENRERLQGHFGGVRADGFQVFGSFSVHPYHSQTPQDGDAFFLQIKPDPKILSPSATARFLWKASGSPQALKLTTFARVKMQKRSGLPNGNVTYPPLCVYNNYHYIVEVEPQDCVTPGKRARAKVLTMRVYTIHDGRCDCNACRRSREQTLAKRSAQALFAEDYALVLVLDTVESGVWKKRRTSDDGDSDMSAASTPSSSSDLAGSARHHRTVNAGGLKGPYVRPLIFCRAEDDLRPSGEIAADSFEAVPAEI
jgi:hypothetical protein